MGKVSSADKMRIHINNAWTRLWSEGDPTELLEAQYGEENL